MTSQNQSTSRLASKEQSGLDFHATESQDLKEAIKLLSNIFDSCFGPHGLCKAIHNNSGGRVIMTSHSSRLLPSMTFSRPILRFLVTALQGHISAYCDQGLFAGRFSLDLITSAFELDFHRHLVSEVFSLLLNICLDYLDSKDCGLKIKFSDDAKIHLKELMVLINSLFAAKPQCGLDCDELHHICMVVMEAYVQIRACSEFSTNIHYVTLEGVNPCESRLVPGFLYDTPQIPVYATNTLANLKHIETSAEKTTIRTLLVGISLAGDTQEVDDNMVLELSDDQCLEAAVVNRLMMFGRQVRDHKVGIFFCQKVVHPELKQYLETHHVLVLDRLGATHTALVQKLTGGSILRSTTFKQCLSGFGTLDNVEHRVCNGKSYLQMTDSSTLDSDCTSSPVVTVLLANRSEEALAELKAVFKASLRVLQSTERDPFYLPGAGCWQTRLSGYVQSQARLHIAKWEQEVGAPSWMLKPITASFTSCLIRAGTPLAEPGQVRAVDDYYSHYWTYCPENSTNIECCACGQIPYSKELNLNDVLFEGKEISGKDKDGDIELEIQDCNVIDSFGAAKNALQCAISIASTVNTIANVISDSN